METSQNLGSSSPTSPRSDASCYAGKPEARAVERLDSRSSSEEPWPPWKQCPRTSMDTSDTENEDGACMVDVRRLLRYRPSIRSPSYHTEEFPGEYVTFEFASRHISQQSCSGNPAGADFNALWARLGAHTSSQSSGKMVQRSHSFSEAVPPETDCPEESETGSPRRVRRENSVPEDWLNSLEEHLPPNACKRCGSLPRSFRHDVPPDTGSKTHQLRARMERLRLQTAEHRPFTIASDQPSRADFIDGPTSYMPQRSGQFSSQDSVENLASSVVHPEHRIYRRDALHGGSWRSALFGLGSKLTRGLWSPHLNDGPMHNSEGHLSHGSSHDSVRSSDSRQLNVIGTFSRACASVINSKTRHFPRLSGLHGVRGNSTAAARIARQREPDYCIPQTILALLSKNESAISASTLQLEADKGPESLPSIPSQANVTLELDDDTDSENSDSSADSYYERNFEAIEDALVDDMFRDSAIYSDQEVSGSEHEVAVKPGRLTRRACSDKLQAVVEKPPPSRANKQQASVESSLHASSPVPVAYRQKGWVKHIVSKFQANMASNS